MMTLSKIIMHGCLFLLSTPILSLSIWYLDRRQVTAITFAQIAALALIIELQAYALQPLPNYYYMIRWGMPDIHLAMGAMALGFFCHRRMDFIQLLSALVALSVLMSFNQVSYLMDGLASIMLGLAFYVFSLQVVKTFPSIWACVIFTLIALTIIPKQAVWGEGTFIQPMMDYVWMLLAIKVSDYCIRPKTNLSTFPQFFSFFSFNRKRCRRTSE